LLLDVRVTLLEVLLGSGWREIGLGNEGLLAEGK
jgi:hypothetical protein